MPGQAQQSQSAPGVSTEGPTCGPSQEAGSGNASEVADAGLGAPVCLGGIDGLRQAVDDGDAEEAWSLVQGLSASDLAELKGDNTLAESVMALVAPERAASVLWMLQYPVDIWLYYADHHCAGSPEALASVLDDVGICDASDIATHLADLDGLTNFLDPDLLDPRILASPVEDQAALISTAEGVDFYLSLHDESPLLVLPELAADSDYVLDLFLLNEHARGLILCDPGELNYHILCTWFTAGDWYVELGFELMDDLEFLISTQQGDWAVALVEVLGPADLTLLPLPATPLTTLILCTVGSLSEEDLVSVCCAIGYEPVDAMQFFFENGWLTLEAAQALLVDSTVIQQAAVSGDVDIVTTLTPFAYIEDVLPLLTAEAGLPVIYVFLPHVQVWLEVDTARFETIARALPEPWIDAFIAAGRLQPLLDFAVADPAGWRALVTDAKFQAILGALQKPCAEAEVPGIWALWTDANRSADSGYALYHTVFGVRIWSTGEQPTYPVSDWTDADTSITYERRGHYVTVQADQNAINTCLARLALLPRGLVSASTIGFGNTRMMEFKKKTPAPPDEDWGDTRAPEVAKEYTTSIHNRSNRFLFMNVTDAGAISAALNRVGSACADLNPAGVGGRRQERDDAGNPVAAPEATDTPLTFFQNHAQHENGHAVGSRAYAEVPRKGDDEAKEYSDWDTSSAAEMRTAYFSGVGANITDVEDSGGNDQEIPSSEIGIYLTEIAETGDAPDAAAAAGSGGQVAHKLPGMNTQQRVDALIDSAAGQKDLPKYVKAILNSGMALPAYSYWTPNFSPTGDKVHIYTGADRGFRQYDTAVLDDMVPVHGWYSQASNREMFAEIYCLHYSTAAHTVPAPHNDTNWTEWFALLEASPDAQLQAGVPPEIAGIGAPPDEDAGPEDAGGGGIVGHDPLEGDQPDETPI
jgi:hypothetical protein